MICPLCGSSHDRENSPYCSYRCKRRRYYLANREKEHEQRLQYRREHKLECKRYREQNKARINEQRRNRCRFDIQYRLSNNLRTRLGDALRNNHRAGSAVRDLGCSIPELKSYLESKFQPGMTWENYGHKTWHIDHIKPLSSFDLTDPEQLKKACHYTNLQPLWAKDNLSKGKKRGVHNE